MPAAALRLGGVQSPFPQVPQSPLGDEPPCEVGALSDTEWPGWGGWGVARSPKRKICLPGTCFSLAMLTTSPLPGASPEARRPASHTTHTEVFSVTVKQPRAG